MQNYPVANELLNSMGKFMWKNSKQNQIVKKFSHEMKPNLTKTQTSMPMKKIKKKLS